MASPATTLPRPVLAVWLVLSACSAEPSPNGGSVPSASSSAAPPLASSEVRSGLWEKARVSGDPLDLAELAQDEGGLTLSASLADARYGDVARAALPFARDAELAVPVLSERIRRGSAVAEREAELLLELLSRESPFGERLDPEGDDKARADLLIVARDKARDKRVRALAVSSLRRLAARGVGREADIPSDLDEP